MQYKCKLFLKKEKEKKNSWKWLYEEEKKKYKPHRMNFISKKTTT